MKRPKKISRVDFELRESSGDLVAIQIAAFLDKIPKKIKFTKKLLHSLIRRKAELSEGVWDGKKVVGAVEGPNPPGIRLVIVKWRNPERDVEDDTSWRYAGFEVIRDKKGRAKGKEFDPDDQADAWGSLRRILATVS